MSPKRCSSPPTEAEEDGNRSQEAKRRRRLLVQDIVAELRPLLREDIERIIRRVVPEEGPKLLANHVQPASRLSINQEKEIKYRLHFQSKLLEPIFTQRRIVAEGRKKIQIAIMDSNLNEVITSNTLSSVKVEIVVVGGDFGGDGQKNWTEEEFKNNVVCQRDDKGPLLVGELVIKLRNGIGYLASVKFTDNSSWIRGRKFRLAAKILQSEIIEERVQEGVSEPFMVKDRRGESSQKPDSPLLTDEVWRLKNIRKIGPFHQRLVGGGIHTVQQFLQALTMNEERLRSLLGDKDKKKEIPNNKWQGMVTHAQKCPVGDKLYSYSVPGKNVVLIFNSIYQLLEAKFDGCNHSMGGLTASQQNLVDNWKRLAYENPNDIHIMDDNLPQPITPINILSVHGSNLLDPQIPYRSGKNHEEATTHVGLWQQTDAPHNEQSHVLFQPEDISTEDKVHSIPESSSFQEPKVSNGLSVGSIPVRLPTEIVTAFPGMILQNSVLPATYTDADMVLQQPLQDISHEQDFNQFQHLAFFQGNASPMRDIFDEHLFRAEPCAGRADYDECGEMVQEYLNPCSHIEVVSTSPRKWVKLIAGLKCGLSLSKFLAARRTGIVHLRTQTEMPSSCFGAPGAGC